MQQNSNPAAQLNPQPPISVLSPPDQQSELCDLLQKLHFTSIDQLLQLQPFTVQKIAARCGLHGAVIQGYLKRLHEIVLRTQLVGKREDGDRMQTGGTGRQKASEKGKEKGDEGIVINFDKIYPGVKFWLQRGQLLEILGRANGGKTTLMISCIKQALQKNIRPILLSSSIFCTDQYLQHIPKSCLTIFQFSDIGELAMLIQCIGNELLSPSPQTLSSPSYVLLIDTLSQIDNPDDDPIEFDCSQKFRRLLTTFTNRTLCPIIYSYRYTVQERSSQAEVQKFKGMGWMGLERYFCGLGWQKGKRQRGKGKRGFKDYDAKKFGQQDA